MESCLVESENKKRNDEGMERAREKEKKMRCRNGMEGRADWDVGRKNEGSEKKDKGRWIDRFGVKPKIKNCAVEKEGKRKRDEVEVEVEGEKVPALYMRIATAFRPCAPIGQDRSTHT